MYDGVCVCVCLQKKKSITDVLATSEPKAGSPVDLQNLVVEHFSDKRSVIEMEDLNLLGERTGENLREP